MEKLGNTKLGYFPIKTIDDERIKTVPHSEQFREKYKRYLFRRMYLNGILIEKKKQNDHYLLLVKDTGIRRKTSITDICREDHMWIMCDSTIGERVEVGEKYVFRGELMPYISKGRLNVGFRMYYMVL